MYTTKVQKNRNLTVSRGNKKQDWDFQLHRLLNKSLDDYISLKCFSNLLIVSHISPKFDVDFSVQIVFLPVQNQVLVLIGGYISTCRFSRACIHFGTFGNGYNSSVIGVLMMNCDIHREMSWNFIKQELIII